jgi:hypothetical protein
MNNHGSIVEPEDFAPIWCRECGNTELKPEMIVFYMGAEDLAGVRYMCERCKNENGIKECRYCHKAIGSDVPMHIVKKTVVCDDCYQGVVIKEPETL